MNDLFISIIGFVICSIVIIYSGSKLSYYGDQIAIKTNMGKAWVGLILLATVTSLPELFTGISSVAIIKEPDLAAGDIFGSCVFNLLILSVLDSQIKKPLFSVIKPSHIISAIFGIILLSISGIALIASPYISTILWISYFSFILFGGYLFAIWIIFKSESNISVDLLPTQISQDHHLGSFRKTIGRYILHATIVVCAALFLPYFGDNITHQTGLSNSFFGTIFIAATTSLPELVVAIAALKMNSIDMAVGNLLGSNIFNMLILGIDDLFYTNGSLYSNISTSHMSSIFIIIIMTAIVCLGLILNPKRNFLWKLSFDTFLIAILYLVLILYLLYTQVSIT